jgi:hypothetical protein
MIELVLTVCSLVQGAACRELDAIPLGNATMITCVLASQVEGAKWTKDNPNFHIRRAVCQPAKRVANS